MEPTKQDPPDHLPPRRRGHLELLLAMVVLLVIQSFVTSTGILQRAVLNLLLLALIASGIRTLSDSRRRVTVALVLGVAAFLVSCVSEVYPSTVAEAFIYCCYITVFGLLLVALCEDVFTEGAVDSNRIIGAISIYLVAGLIWAFAYSLLETLRPGSFAIAAMSAEVGVRHELISEFMYFSNVTLTTLGYGDIVPNSRPAQMLATLQAIFGQLYLTVVVARLVGLQISRARFQPKPLDQDIEE